MYFAVCEPEIVYRLESTSHLKYVVRPLNAIGPGLDELARFAGEHVGNLFIGAEAEKNYAILKNVFKISLDKGTCYCGYNDLVKNASQIFSGSYSGSDSGLYLDELSHVDPLVISELPGADSLLSSESSSGYVRTASGITPAEYIDFDAGFQLLDGVCYFYSCLLFKCTSDSFD